MNTILGNRDRHGNNYMTSGGGGKGSNIHMIDHGLAFQHFGGAMGTNYTTPTYLQGTSKLIATSTKSWVLGLNADKLAGHMKKNGIPDHIVQNSHGILTHMQNHLREDHAATGSVPQIGHLLSQSRERQSGVVNTERFDSGGHTVTTGHSPTYKFPRGAKSHAIPASANRAVG